MVRKKRAGKNRNAVKWETAENPRTRRTGTRETEQTFQGREVQALPERPRKVSDRRRVSRCGRAPQYPEPGGTYGVSQGGLALLQAPVRLREQAARILNSVLILTAQGPDSFHGRLEVVEAVPVAAPLAPCLGQLETERFTSPWYQEGKGG